MVLDSFYNSTAVSFEDGELALASAYDSTCFHSMQTVESPALAVMVPLLLKGLKESTPIQRKSCVIITNMSKLVNSPVDAVNFLPK